MRVAIIPFITDIPAAIISFLLAANLESSPILGVIALLGSAFLAYLAIQNLTVRRGSFQFKEAPSATLKKAATVNLLNPNYYIFWFSIATPTFAEGSVAGSILFAGSIITCSSLAMIALSLGTHSIRQRFFDYAFWALRFLGLLLALYAIRLLVMALQLLG